MRITINCLNIDMQACFSCFSTRMGPKKWFKI